MSVHSPRMWRTEIAEAHGRVVKREQPIDPKSDWIGKNDKRVYGCKTPTEDFLAGHA